MAINRIIQFLRPPIGVQPLDPQIQYSPYTGKGPFEIIHKLIKKGHQEIQEIKKENQIASSFWQDELEIPDFSELIIEKRRSHHNKANNKNEY